MLNKNRQLNRDKNKLWETSSSNFYCPPLFRTSSPGDLNIQDEKKRGKLRLPFTSRSELGRGKYCILYDPLPVFFFLEFFNEWCLSS